MQHSIEVDRERLLVDVRVRGFLMPEEAGWLGEEIRAAVLTLGEGVGRHVTLYDLTEMRVSPQATHNQTMAAFASPAVRPLWARRVAACSPSALHRMQVSRLRAVRPDLGVYATREEALAWLLEE